MTINKSNAMSTAKKKQSNNGSNSTIKNDSTQSSEFKFTEEPQSSLNSSDSGQQYDIVDDSPFAIVKQGNIWKIVIGNLIASPRDFKTKEAAAEYVKEKHWETIWVMVVWLINNQSKFITQTEKEE
jgi:hypothetical protein